MTKLKLVCRKLDGMLRYFLVDQDDVILPGQTNVKIKQKFGDTQRVTVTFVVDHENIILDNERNQPCPKTIP